MKRFDCIDVDFVNDGKQLVDKVTTTKIPYGIIMSDYEMPIMNGEDAFKQITALFKSGAIVWSKCPMVSVTSKVASNENDHEETIQLLQAAGADNVLGKPFPVSRLADELRRYGLLPHE